MHKLQYQIEDEAVTAATVILSKSKSNKRSNNGSNNGSTHGLDNNESTDKRI